MKRHRQQYCFLTAVLLILAFPALADDDESIATGIGDDYFGAGAMVELR